MADVPPELRLVARELVEKGWLDDCTTQDGGPCFLINGSGLDALAYSRTTDNWEWSEALPPSEWRKKLSCSQSTLTRYVENGTLVIDKIGTKLWRIRLDTLEKLTGTKPE